VTDTLSRAPTSSASKADIEFHQDIEMFVNLVMENLPVTEQRLAELQQQQDLSAAEIILPIRLAL